MKKILILAVIAVAAFGLFSLLSRNPNVAGTSDENADMILFWGNGCPHCETVKEYIDSNDMNSKLKISQKEVYYNKTNQRQMEEYANKCPELNPAEGLGVPFAWIDNKCVIGSDPIINAMNQKAAQN